jgi:hypothetical protein
MLDKLTAVPATLVSSSARHHGAPGTQMPGWSNPTMEGAEQ